MHGIMTPHVSRTNHDEQLMVREDCALSENYAGWGVITPSCDGTIEQGELENGQAR
jgi:hypothetical protein